jgi:hypothetical protein
MAKSQQNLKTALGKPVGDFLVVAQKSMNLLDMRNRRELVKTLNGSRESSLKTTDGGKWTRLEGAPNNHQKIIVKKLVNKPFALMGARSQNKYLLDSQPYIIQEEYSQEPSFVE